MKIRLVLLIALMPFLVGCGDDEPDSGKQSVVDISGGEQTDDGFHYGDFYYTFGDNVATIAKADKLIVNAVIPAKVRLNGEIFDVAKIGRRAFKGCSAMRSITIPNSITAIGDYAFTGCSGMISVTIPNSITRINDNAFYECSGLTSMIWNAKKCFSNGFMPTDGITNVKIGNEVEILPYHFLKNSKITEITIPNSVTFIGGEAFYGCNGLTSVTIPNSVTSIGDFAFYCCTGLTSVEIPNSVTTIYWSAFRGCSGLTSVAIPNSVTKIDAGVFYGCSSLTSIAIPNAVTSIGNFAFYECSGLCSLTIGNSVTSIDFSAFQDCRNLTSVTIPNSVTSIGNSAFSGCRMLQNLTIGENVKIIGDYAFKNCKYLMDVTNYATVPQVINANVFENVDVTMCNLTVWDISYNFYIREPAWKDFIIKVAGVDGVLVDEATNEVEGYYDLKGVRLNEPLSGQVNIVRYKDGTSQKVVVKK